MGAVRPAGNERHGRSACRGGSPVRRPIGIACLALAVLSCAGPRQAPPASRPSPGAADTTHLVVTRPTVIAFFLVPDGAVDTLPNLAVEADDWNFGMAALGDSLEASGIALALGTRPLLRLSSAGTADVTLTLGDALASGYVFVRPGEPPCMRRGAMDQDAALAAARAAFGGRGLADPAWREQCVRVGPRASPSGI